MPFATTEQVQARLGRSLVEGESDTVEILIELATGSIAAAAGQTDAWAEALDPVPAVVRGVCIEIVTRCLANPQGIRSLQEQLGQAGSTVIFRDTGLLPTDDEARLVRRAIGIPTVASVRVQSLVHDVYATEPSDVA